MTPPALKAGRARPMLKDQAEPFAYLDTGDDLPGFRQIICRRDGELLIPVVDLERGEITEFETVSDIDAADLIKVQPQPPVRVGEKAIYVYKFPHQRGRARPDVVVGDKTSISLAVHRGMRRLRGFPFARLEAAAFMHDSRRAEQFAREAACKVLLSSEKATLGQAKALVADYLGDSPVHDRWLMAEFCRGLIGYYRLYRRLLHVSDPATKQRLQSRFDTSARFILPFLIDDDFLGRIEEDALGGYVSDESGEVVQRVEEDVTRILAGLGVSRGSSALFLNRIQDVLSRQSELPFPAVEPQQRFVADHVRLSRAGLIVPLTYSAIRYRESVDQSLGRWHKRLAKQRMDTNFASLAYGLLIVIHTEVAPDSRTADLRAFGLASLNAGLRAMSYSRTAG